MDGSIISASVWHIDWATTVPHGYFLTGLCLMCVHSGSRHRMLTYEFTGQDFPPSPMKILFSQMHLFLHVWVHVMPRKPCKLQTVRNNYPVSIRWYCMCGFAECREAEIEGNAWLHFVPLKQLWTSDSTLLGQNEIQTESRAVIYFSWRLNTEKWGEEETWRKDRAGWNRGRGVSWGRRRGQLMFLQRLP